MVDVVISGKLAERLQRIAQQKQRPVEDVLENALDLVENAISETGTAALDYEAVRQVNAKLYEIARTYWRRVGDQERLALTDDELDEQFWLIDHEGIPHLKSEQGTVDLPPDPLELIVDLFADSDLTDMSTTIDETVTAHYRKRHERSA